MPRRSNQFQEVVFIIQSHLAAGSRVEESEELRDLLTGAAREVDICIHSEVGGHDVIVSVECRAHKRKQTVEWVEAMHAKHQRLPTNLLVLASSSGFTAEALLVAEKHGIQTVVPGDVPETFAGEVTRRLDSLWLKTVSMCADRVVATLESAGPHPEQHVRFDSDVQLFRADGTKVAALSELVDRLLHERFDPNVMRDATGDEKYFQIVAPMTSNDGSFEGLFVRKEDKPEPLLRRILSLEITGPAKVQVAEMPLTHGELLGKEYVAGTTSTDRHDVLLVVTDPTQDGFSGGKSTIRFRPRGGK